MLFLGLAVFAGLGGAQVLSGSDHEFRHERSADNENTFLDFAFVGRVEVNNNPVECVYRIPVLNIKRLIRPRPVTREIYVDQFRVVAFTNRDRDVQSFEKRYPLIVPFPSPDAEVERQVGPIEFSIPKLALPRSSYIGLALVGTEVLRHIQLPGMDVLERRAMWPIVVPSNGRGYVTSIPDAPTDVVKAAFDDWKTPSDPKLLFIGKNPLEGIECSSQAAGYPLGPLTTDIVLQPNVGSWGKSGSRLCMQIT